MIQNLFNEKKATHAAAYFLFRACGPLTVPKLMKMLYLAERGSFERYGMPMIGDRLVSMPYGPVLLITYNHMSGELESVPDGWDSWITGRAEHSLDLRDRGALKLAEDDLLELSDADLAVLNDVWQKFGQMSASALQNWSHKNCPEWHDPARSMIPIVPDDLFAVLKFTPEQKREAMARLQAESNVNAAFASVKE